MGRAQVRVLMTVLVVALLGGSAELARCPEVVSFSRSALPVAAAQSLPVTAGYQAASFHVPAAKNNLPVGAHETLLKASMPVDHGAGQATQIAPKHRGVSSAPASLRSKQNRKKVQRAGGLVVLTSWEEEALPRRVFVEERVIFTSYAAVPTAGGWLVIQL